MDEPFGRVSGSFTRPSEWFLWVKGRLAETSRKQIGNGSFLDKSSCGFPKEKDEENAASSYF